MDGDECASPFRAIFVVVPRLARLQVVAPKSKIEVEIRAAALAPDIEKPVDIEANRRPLGTEGAPTALRNPDRNHVRAFDIVLGGYFSNQAAKPIVDSDNRPLFFGTA